MTRDTVFFETPDSLAMSLIVEVRLGGSGATAGGRLGVSFGRGFFMRRRLYGAAGGCSHGGLAYALPATLPPGQPRENTSRNSDYRSNPGSHNDKPGR